MQKNFHFLIMLLPFLFILATQYSDAVSEDILFVARPTSHTYYEGDIPTIVGVVKDQQGQALENVKVSASFFSHNVSTTTNNVGSYALTPSVAAPPGQHSVNVVATKDGFVRIATVTFEIQKKSTTIDDVPAQIITTVEAIPETIQSIPSIVSNEITKNPISNTILDQIESQKKFFEQEDKQLAYEQFLDEQRKLEQASLEKDLNSFNQEYEAYSPRSAFSDFVMDVDETVQDIFWGQFELTEKLTHDAQQAKFEALENGNTPEQAMKVFQRKAAITHAELVAHNEELNIKYGHAQKDIQNKFDEHGKLPRYD